VILEKDGDVRSEEVLQRIKEEKNILQTIKIRRSNSIFLTKVIPMCYEILK